MEDSERWGAVGCIEARQSITDVALFFGVNHSVISCLWKQFQTTQTVVRRPVGGRPRVTTPRGRSIYCYCSQADSQSDLHTCDIYGYSVVRLKWCRGHGNWTVSDWGNGIFTDESRFALEPDDKRIRIWRKQETRNQPQNITEHHAFRSVMVWAGISLGYRTDLHIFKRGSVTAVRYRDQVLEPIVRLYTAVVGPTFVLMDDNARSHRADIVDD
ncbi:transposable element Tcb2 transposase [Trichonephila clavipes]|uniref:Transposable element Tcb2 transposase n=1 Tax=Trichonephila clavipes TaxID=2585209 RepID=A0A8X7B7B6_TRICX|nr:transposable element Tcb2 transposase [Trichonephila clavipes]